ncbi:MAG: NAD-dependent epimerase/dehydratase family protein [Chloroflexi bacterium]|nr:NAD-dependent epimerase/dehydratase family protein [Chloroflexota bacterium]
MAGLTVRAAPARTFVTGGAGFIGSELVSALLADGGEITVLDNLSSAAPDWVDRMIPTPRLSFVEGDAASAPTVRAAMAGHDRVVHLAAGTDIAAGHGHPERDFASGIVATEVVCEAMREHGIRELWYASSGVVYGHPTRTPTAEDDGPLRPESHYAAAKVAGEAIIAGFAHLYDWRAFAFRFGNTVGARSDHGVVHDFVVKLLRDPTRLEILGDGSQAKPYVAVDDLVAGMRHAADRAPLRPLTVLNLGPEGTLLVRRVAELVIEAIGLSSDAVELSFSGAAPGGGGWPGDTAVVEFDISAARALGWQPRASASAAVQAAARGIAATYRATGRPLLTSQERRAAARLVPGPGLR